MRAVAILAIGMLAGTPGFSHRLDEYLQGTILSIEKTRILGQMILTPGVAVYPFVNSSIDSDGDGTISQAEQRAYAAQVLRDVSLTSDGQPLKIQLLATHFATLADMKEGRGEIQLDFAADLPRGARSRKLTFENHHQIRIAAYSVNTLVPSDPDLRITSQNRNYSQSLYDVEY